MAGRAGGVETWTKPSTVTDLDLHLDGFPDPTGFLVRMVGILVDGVLRRDVAGGPMMRSALGRSEALQVEGGPSQSGQPALALPAPVAAVISGPLRRSRDQSAEQRFQRRRRQSHHGRAHLDARPEQDGSVIPSWVISCDGRDHGNDPDDRHSASA